LNCICNWSIPVTISVEIAAIPFLFLGQIKKAGPECGRSAEKIGVPGKRGCWGGKILETPASLPAGRKIRARRAKNPGSTPNWLGEK
jgi:hypothetical protein